MKVDVIDGNILAYWTGPPDQLQSKPVLYPLVVSSCLFVKERHWAGTLKIVLQTPFSSYRSLTLVDSFSKRKITTCFAFFPPQHLAILLWFSEEAFGCLLSNFRTPRLLHFHFVLGINKKFISRSVVLLGCYTACSLNQYVKSGEFKKQVEEWIDPFHFTEVVVEEKKKSIRQLDTGTVWTGILSVVNVFGKTRRNVIFKVYSSKIQIFWTLY